MPLVSCRVSAQSVGKVESVDTVLKGAGNENKLVPLHTDEREVWCWDWVTARGGGRGIPGGRWGLRMRWNGFREGGCVFGVITKKGGCLGLGDWTEKSICEGGRPKKTLCFCRNVTATLVFVTPLRGCAVWQTFCQITDSERGVSTWTHWCLHASLHESKAPKLVARGIRAGERVVRACKWKHGNADDSLCIHVHR